MSSNTYNLQINHKDTGDDIVVVDKDTLDTRFNQETKNSQIDHAVEELNERNNVNVATDGKESFHLNMRILKVEVKFQ